MFFFKNAINQKNPFYSELCDEIQIVPYVFISFNCPLSAAYTFLSMYWLGFNMVLFEMGVVVDFSLYLIEFKFIWKLVKI